MLVSITDQKLGTGIEMGRALKINVIGGGPGGLYFSLLMKLANPRHEITIFERNRADDTFGFGVVFSETLKLYVYNWFS